MCGLIDFWKKNNDILSDLPHQKRIIVYYFFKKFFFFKYSKINLSGTTYYYNKTKYIG